ncbi:hypothetical protein CDD83_9699 [Cordyceps sp. RAO-2017]|nr:hypothetical protein CDD83_9699 [Cordyceps sp. RAO-2017]
MSIVPAVVSPSTRSHSRFCLFPLLRFNPMTPFIATASFSSSSSPPSTKGSCWREGENEAAARLTGQQKGLVDGQDGVASSTIPALLGRRSEDGAAASATRSVRAARPVPELPQTQQVRHSTIMQAAVWDPSPDRWDDRRGFLYAGGPYM